MRGAGVGAPAVGRPCPPVHPGGRRALAARLARPWGRARAPSWAGRPPPPLPLPPAPPPLLGCPSAPHCPCSRAVAWWSPCERSTGSRRWGERGHPPHLGTGHGRGPHRPEGGRDRWSPPPGWQRGGCTGLRLHAHTRASTTTERTKDTHGVEGGGREREGGGNTIPSKESQLAAQVPRNTTKDPTSTPHHHANTHSTLHPTHAKPLFVCPCPFSHKRCAVYGARAPRSQ
jgi:hypothetical protein